MDLGDDIGDPGQHIVRAQYPARGLDRLGEPAPVAGRLADGVRDQGGGLGDVELQSAGPAGPGQLGGAEEQQPVTFGRRQSHVVAPPG